MTIWLWVGFLILVLALLALDLGVFNRKSHVVSTKEALGWTAFWIALSLAFNALVYVIYEHHWLGIGLELGHPLSGREAAIKFFTAYLVEKSLSLDNIFVIAMIFGYFKVPAQHQHRVLFWGILGALIMRGAMIGAGIAVIRRFDWLIYVFGGFLLVTAVKMLVAKDGSIDPEKNRVVLLIRRWYPVTSDFHGARFFVLEAGRRVATPLALALVIVETTDLLFAVDSIPAVFAVTLDPFIVFTSNVFAILGLRSLYFALAAVLDRFRYLKISLVFILAFVGVKMILSHHHPISPLISLALIVGILLVGVLASLLANRINPTQIAASPEDEQVESHKVRGAGLLRFFVILAGTTLVVVGTTLFLFPDYGLGVVLAAVALLGLEFLLVRTLMPAKK